MGKKGGGEEVGPHKNDCVDYAAVGGMGEKQEVRWVLQLEDKVNDRIRSLVLFPVRLIESEVWRFLRAGKGANLARWGH